jgi:predicted Zn-dependent peptidase
VLSLESTGARMNRLGGSVLADLPILSVEEIIARIDAVTVDDVRALAEELFGFAGLSVAAIGPDEDALRSALAPLEGIAA